MPITIGQVNLELKLLPLTLNEDGSASVTVRKGYTNQSGFVVISTTVFAIPPADVSTILDTTGEATLTRRDDLSLAVYNYLVANNLVETGVIS